MGAYPAGGLPRRRCGVRSCSRHGSSVVDGDPESLVTSPVVLAVAPQFARAAAGKLSWIEVPTSPATMPPCHGSD